jgi:hypothetical protein
MWMIISVPVVDCSIELFPKGFMFTNISLQPVNIENLAAGKNCYETLPSCCVTLLSTLGSIQFYQQNMPTFNHGQVHVSIKCMGASGH